MKKGVILLAIQLALVLSVAAKYSLDRETLPKQWFKTAPYDPDHWLRGRYVRFRVEDCPPANCQTSNWQVLVFYIPEHVPDPSLRAPGEELWVEATIPRKGPLRPVRLGVKKDGNIEPLNLR
ncbi:MAG: GDYXXLXY domain-containing protein [Acidobacteria bacterium]|nr:GDYXXLXY domain-containing protein [Acidobacteriota bacterium]